MVEVLLVEVLLVEVLLVEVLLVEVLLVEVLLVEVLLVEVLLVELLMVEQFLVEQLSVEHIVSSSEMKYNISNLVYFGFIFRKMLSWIVFESIDHFSEMKTKIDQSPILPT